MNTDAMVQVTEIDWGTAVERVEDVPDSYLEALNSHDLLSYTIGRNADFRTVRLLLSEALRAVVQLTAQLASARLRIKQLEAQLRART